MVILLVLLTIAAFLIADYGLGHRRIARAAELESRAAPEAADIARVPWGTYITRGHTWLRPEGDGELRLGAGRIPLHALGAVDEVQLLPAGASVMQGEPIAVLVRGARRLRLVAPVDGVIERVNETLERRPARLSTEPFGAGWLYTIRASEPAPALRRAFVAEEAERFLRRETARLRDALCRAVEFPHAAPVLGDGGVPLPGLAERLDDAQWTRLCRSMFEASGPGDNENE